ncbi:MAG: alpha/beta hydrolase [Planctomycetales bacterium]
MRTLGGLQFWTDQFLHGNWRIQRHALTGGCRLLDGSNVLRGWGTAEDCRARFEELRAELKLPALTKTVVVTVHGLVRTRNAMQPMCDYLAQQGEWSGLNFSYASTRKNVDDHARALQGVIEQLEGVEEVHLVGHSLGNIVIRHCLADRARGAEKGARIGRVVMLAPPNQGAAVARVLGKTKLFEWILGGSAHQLGPLWEELQERLQTPRDFGVIAGSLLGGKGGNPLISGDDDLLVGVEETKLSGASDFLVIPSPHTFIMLQQRVMEATLRFLQQGYFVSEKERVRLG